MERRAVLRDGRVERGWLRFAGLDAELPYIEIESGGLRQGSRHGSWPA